MEKYLVSEIPQNQQVVIDVPEGHLRIAGYVDSDRGDGRMVFSRSYKHAEVGSHAGFDADAVPLLQMHIQSRERALVIARAFLKLAEDMEQWEDDATASDACEECSCDDCPQHDFCFADDEEDNEEDKDNG